MWGSTPPTLGRCALLRENSRPTRRDRLSSYASFPSGGGPIPLEALSSPPPASGNSVRLRAWQQDALARFEASQRPSFLAVATPGAGKTTFALAAALRALLARQVQRLVVVVPTQHLKQQWAHAAERLGIHLDPEWSAGYGSLPSDVHGVAVTYQQVAASPAAMPPLVRGSMVVLDEIHHAGESRTWGDAVRMAFAPATRRLCLSGTPFRSDQNIIPFVLYDGDLAQADYEYGYGDALKDRGVVRPVYFPRINGRMEWTSPDGTENDATFDDRLTRELANQRLRTALDVEGEWLPSVLAQAHAQLLHLRTRDPSTGGLVIAIDQDHARGIAAIMSEKLGVTPTLSLSDDPTASDKITAFGNGLAPWIVAVRMVSEGVDIPRLRVGVFATNTTTELFFRQAVGRLLRFRQSDARQTAYMFIPDDIRLRTFANGIAEQRRHCLRKLEKEDEFGGGGEEAPPKPAEAQELEEPQLSLFSAISATPLDLQGRPIDSVTHIEEEPEEAIPDLAADASATTLAPLVLAPISPPLPAPEAVPAAPPVQGALARRRELREKNSEIARDLAFAVMKTHAEVNSELNRRAGIKRISEASVKQLEKRLVLAKEWLKKR
jgi:superfamily II DNA or RNA helicase